MQFKNYTVLREVLDKIPEDLSIKWHPELTSGQYADQYVAYFYINKIPYYVGFSKAVKFPTKTRNKKGLFGYYVLWDMYRGSDSPEAAFGPESDPELDTKDKSSWWNSDFSRTHKGDSKVSKSIEVLRHVFAAMLQFIKVLNPALISYRPADRQLSKFYNMISNRYSSSLGYEFYGRHFVRKDVLKRWGPQIDWFLQNADQIV